MKRISERFWSKVNQCGVSDCWPWLASISKGGYGKFGKGGKFGGWIEAHRVAYELSKGTIPPGGQILHSCDNRLCCNPEHLSVGSANDNVQDKVRKGRGRSKSYCGERNGNAHLTDQQVVHVRERYRSGESRASLAADFAVSWTQVDRIVSEQSRTKTDVEISVLRAHQ